MTNQRIAYVLAAVFAPLRVGDEFERSEWPAHVTVVGNFEVEHPKSLIRALCGAGAWGAPLRVTLGDIATFDARDTLRVRLVADDGPTQLHERLAPIVESLDGFAAHTPGFWHDGFRPHLTRHERHDAGDTIDGVAVVLAALQGPLARIVAVFSFPSPSPDAQTGAHDHLR